MLPPRESCSRRVSFESRYGMCFEELSATKDEITFPKADSERFIFVASFRRWFEAKVFDWRSLPARSTKFSLPTLYF